MDRGIRLLRQGERERAWNTWAMLVAKRALTIAQLRKGLSYMRTLHCVPALVAWANAAELRKAKFESARKCRRAMRGFDLIGREMMHAVSTWRALCRAQSNLQRFLRLVSLQAGAATEVEEEKARKQGPGGVVVDD